MIGEISFTVRDLLCRMIPRFAVCIALSSILTKNASAEITYVDAVDGGGGNTYETGGSPGDTVRSWLERTALGTDGNIYQGGYSADEPELTTEVTGLVDGTYVVWVFFWDATGANTWTISAGLTSCSLSIYSFDGPGDTASPVAANSLSFAIDPLFTESDRTFYGVNLGEITVSGGLPIKVYIDDYNTPVDADTRTWYDGIGYEPPPPPKGTLIIIR